MNRQLKKIFLALLDYLFLVIALYLVVSYRYNNFNYLIFIKHFRFFGFIFFSWILIFYIFNFYSLTIKLRFKHYFTAIIIDAAITISFFYIMPQPEITPKTNLVLILFLFSIFFYLGRSIFSIFSDKFGARNRTIIIGADKHSLDLAEDIIKYPKLGYKLISIFKHKREKLPEIFNNIKIIDQVEKLVQFTLNNNIHTIVVSDKWFGTIFKDLYNLIPSGINFYNIASFWEDFNHTIPVYATNEIWFLENLKYVNKKIFEFFKRITDLLLVIIILPFVLILTIFIAFGIKISSPGPIFYKQIRVGRKDKSFKIYKFRSMINNAEKNGAQWAGENDPRITKFGNFLRLTRLDELPQFFNILKGNMSFVGPRPERPEFVSDLEQKIPHYNLRHIIRPGLTGWAQVNFEYASTEEDTAIKLSYDLYYLKNRSFVLDIKIVLKTIMTVISKKGR